MDRWQHTCPHLSDDETTDIVTFYVRYVSFMYFDVDGVLKLLTIDDNHNNVKFP